MLILRHMKIFLNQLSAATDRICSLQEEQQRLREQNELIRERSEKSVEVRARPQGQWAHLHSGRSLTVSAGGPATACPQGASCCCASLVPSGLWATGGFLSTCSPTSGPLHTEAPSSTSAPTPAPLGCHALYPPMGLGLLPCPHRSLHLPPSFVCCFVESLACSPDDLNAETLSDSSQNSSSAKNMLDKYRMVD